MYISAQGKTERHLLVLPYQHYTRHTSHPSLTHTNPVVGQINSSDTWHLQLNLVSLMAAQQVNSISLVVLTQL